MAAPRKPRSTTKKTGGRTTPRRVRPLWERFDVSASANAGAQGATAIGLVAVVVVAEANGEMHLVPIASKGLTKERQIELFTAGLDGVV